jgi:hypothetical protein
VGVEPGKEELQEFVDDLVEAGVDPSRRPSRA